jgi:hypothetical protein
VYTYTNTFTGDAEIAIGTLKQFTVDSLISLLSANKTFTSDSIVDVSYKRIEVQIGDDSLTATQKVSPSLIASKYIDAITGTAKTVVATATCHNTNLVASLCE